MIARGSQQSFADRLEPYRHRVEARIRSALQPDAGIPPRLVEAVEYAVLGPG